MTVIKAGGLERQWAHVFTSDCKRISSDCDKFLNLNKVSGVCVWGWGRGKDLQLVRLQLRDFVSLCNCEVCKWVISSFQLQGNSGQCWLSGSFWLAAFSIQIKPFFLWRHSATLKLDSWSLVRLPKWSKVCCNQLWSCTHPTVSAPVSYTNPPVKWRQITRPLWWQSASPASFHHPYNCAFIA